MTADQIPSPTELRELATTDPDRHGDWEIAFHEAGHVVVEVAMGSLPDLVYINDDHRLGDDHVGRTVTRSFAAARWFPAALPDLAVILASGDVADHIAVGTELDIDDRVSRILGGDAVGTDQLQLQELVTSMAPVEGEALLRQAHLRAESILRDKWDTVRLITRQLVWRRSLTREDLWDLLDPPSAPH